MSARSSHNTGFWKVALLGGADCAIPRNEPSIHKTANMIIDRTTTPFAMNLVFTDSLLLGSKSNIDNALLGRSEHQKKYIVGSQRECSGEMSRFDRNFFLADSEPIHVSLKRTLHAIHA